jgi:hypothetical protein
MIVLLRLVILPLVIFCISAALFVEAAKRYPVYVFGIIALLILIGLVRGTRQRKLERTRGWRLRRASRDTWYYEELRCDAWHRIEIFGEMLIGAKADYVIFLGSLKLPKWAEGRRDEIISHLKSEFPPPKYEYDEAG